MVILTGHSWLWALTTILTTDPPQERCGREWQGVQEEAAHRGGNFQAGMATVGWTTSSPVQLKQKLQGPDSLFFLFFASTTWHCHL